MKSVDARRRSSTSRRASCLDHGAVAARVVHHGVRVERRLQQRLPASHVSRREQTSHSVRVRPARARRRRAERRQDELNRRRRVFVFIVHASRRRARGRRRGARDGALKTPRARVRSRDARGRRRRRGDEHRRAPRGSRASLRPLRRRATRSRRVVARRVVLGWVYYSASIDRTHRSSTTHRGDERTRSRRISDAPLRRRARRVRLVAPPRAVRVL